MCHLRPKHLSNVGVQELSSQLLSPLSRRYRPVGRHAICTRYVKAAVA